MQTVFPAAFPGGISFTRTFSAVGGIHLGELANGGFCRFNGDPIQDESEIYTAIPAQHQKRALEWFARRDEEEPQNQPPAVMWKNGRLCYVETGAELTSHADIIQAFPEDSPMQHAALEWFGMQQANHNREATKVHAGPSGMVPVRDHDLVAVSPGKVGTGIAKRDISKG